jgi:hypothetical protein
MFVSVFFFVFVCADQIKENLSSKESGNMMGDPPDGKFNLQGLLSKVCKMY